MTATHTLLAFLLFLVPAPVLHGWLGVYLADRGQPTVIEVIPDSPADKAGMRPGDVILAIDGTAVDSIEGLQQSLMARVPGDRVRVKVRRKERTRNIEVVLGPRPQAVAAQPGTGRPANKLPAPSPETRPVQDPAAGQQQGKPYVGIAVTEGDGALVIDRVLDGDPGDRAGLQPADRITHWNNRRIRDLDALAGFLRNVHPGDKVALTVVRGNGTHSIVVTVGSVPGSTVSRPRTGPRSRAEPAATPQPVLVRPVPVSYKDPLGTDLDAAKKKAKTVGKRVLAVFGASWSSSSHAFRRSLQRQDLLSAMSLYECVWLDTDAHSDLADKLGVRGLPHVVIFDGDEVAFQRAGYLPPDLFLPLLKEHAAGGERPQGSDVVVEQPVLPDAEVVDAGLETALERVQGRLRDLNRRMQRLQQSRAEEIRSLRRDLDALRKILEDLKKRAR